MLNRFAKCILVSTSLSPMLFAIAVNRFEQGKPWWHYASYLLGAVALWFVCSRMMKFASRKGQKHILYIKEFNRRDQGILTFLFIYLFPFLQSPNSSFAAGWISSIFIFGIIIFTMIDVGAYHFNPMMRLLGYRFYMIKDCDDVRHLLITKTVLRKPGLEIRTRRIAHDVYIHTEDANA